MDIQYGILLRNGDSFKSFDHVNSSMVWKWVVKSMRNAIFKSQPSLFYQVFHNILQSIATFNIVALSTLVEFTC